MDPLSSFSSPDFDVKKWINESIPSSHKAEASHQLASSLRMKLQILSVEIGQSLDDLCSQSVARLPKVMRDVDHIKKKASGLKSTISNFETQIMSLEDDTSKYMNILKGLDHAKHNMDRYYAIVREMEKLKKMVSHIESVFQGTDYKQMASTLADMRQSYDLVKDIPQFKEETVSLDSYESGLIDKVLLALRDALKRHHNNDCIDCLAILDQFKHSHRAIDVYESVLKEVGIKEWKKHLTLPIEDQLSSYYEDIIPVIHSEVSRSMKVFKSSLACNIISTLHGIVNDELSKLSSKLTYDQYLILHNHTQQFEHNIKTLFDPLTPSERTNIFSCIYQPYFNSIQEFHYIEKARLLKSLNPVKPKHGDFSETIHNLKESIPNLFKLLDQSVHRCIQLTLGTQFENLMNALSSALVEYLVHLGKSLGVLRELTALDESSKDSKRIHKRNEQEDWKEIYLQGSIQFLEGILTFKSRLSEFTNQLKNHILTKKKDIFKSLDPLILTDLGSAFCPNEQKAKRLASFFKKVEDEGKILPSPEGVFESLVNQSKQFVIDVTTSFIKINFEGFQSLEEWSQQSERTDTINFSLSPQLYIKLIVEHLLVLPQLLEPYEENELLKPVDFRSLKINMRNSQTLKQDESNETNDWSLDAGFSNSLISVVASETQELYVQHIQKIPKLTDMGKSQLFTDISHLFNVIDVFGLEIDENLQTLQKSFGQVEAET